MDDNHEPDQMFCTFRIEKNIDLTIFISFRNVDQSFQIFRNIWSGTLQLVSCGQLRKEEREIEREGGKKNKSVSWSEAARE